MHLITEHRTQREVHEMGSGVVAAHQLAAHAIHRQETVVTAPHLSRRDMAAQTSFTAAAS